MFLDIVRFELRYRFKRPATFLYFLLVFLVGFLCMAWEEFGGFGAGGQVKMNSTYVLYNVMGLVSIIPMLFVSSAIMGVPVVRDYEHQMESILFSTRMKKTDYLLGRFTGSFIILLFISLGALLGPILGAAMPWTDKEKFLPFTAELYFKPYLFLLTSLLIQALIYFAGGITGKRMLYVYLQCVLFVGLNIVSQIFFTDVEDQRRAALLDPFGYYTFTEATRYWTIVEKNHSFIPYRGIFLLNRLLWTGVAAVLFSLACWRFRFGTSGAHLSKKKAAVRQDVLVQSISLPAVHLKNGTAVNISKFFSSLRIYVREITRSIPFWGIVAFAFVIFFTNASYADKWYGAGNWPLTYVMLDVINVFSIYMYAVIVFYSGELIWRERDVKIDQIKDVSPVSDILTYAAKMAALMWIMVVLHLALVVLAMATQAAKGYTHFEFPVYLEYISNLLLNLFIVSCVSFFFHLIVKNKFIGFALTIVFLMVDFAKDQFGLRHPLVSFNSGSLGQYSDMNHFAASSLNFFWMKSYWLGFALLLLGIGILLGVRGTEFGWKQRVKSWHDKLNMSMKVYMGIALLLFIGAGITGFINYNKVNTYETEKEGDIKRANYEKDLKKYDEQLQLETVAVNLQTDLYPANLMMKTSGYYTLKNIDTTAISTVYIQLPMSKSLTDKLISFSTPFTKEKDFPQHRFSIYHLQKPVQPGDSIQMNFQVEYLKKGFGNPDVNFVQNGTFFGNDAFFPSIGYENSNELNNIDKRKKYKLPVKDNYPNREDSSKWNRSLFGIRKRVRFESTISTDTGQIAIAPGYLQKDWTDKGRHYFHYKMDAPIFNFYNIVSARYAVQKENYKGISLEIYYHPLHDFNVGLFLTAMKESIDYYTANFGPYEYRQLRIMEFPRYRQFAQSFPNTVPFSEAMGFIMRKNKPDDLDMTFYVTAHEIGHQWWGHQVTEAAVKGGQMFSESLSQYSALMTLKKHYSPAQIKKYLKYELDRYLSARGQEKKREYPITQEDGQGYIYYQKGTLVFYALQDYIGEDKVNAVLKKLIDHWAFRDDRYLTTDVMVNYFREVVPDSLHYLINDLFNNITLYDNKVINPSYKKISEHDYEVTIPVSSMKYYADSLGNETKTVMKDLIPIGVMGADKNGKDSLLAIQKVWISKDLMTFTMHTKSVPVKAGIDPLNMLIDRDTNDNLDVVEQKK